jgi:hypothetical protein
MFRQAIGERKQRGWLNDACYLAKVGVEGSNPFARSKISQQFKGHVDALPSKPGSCRHERTGNRILQVGEYREGHAAAFHLRSRGSAMSARHERPTEVQMRVLRKIRDSRPIAGNNDGWTMTHDLPRPTIWALVRKGLIEPRVRGFPTTSLGQTHRLTGRGREALFQISAPSPPRSGRRA